MIPNAMGRHPQDHVAVVLAWPPDLQDAVDKFAIERDPQLPAPASGRRGLLDPGHSGLEGFVGLVGNRDADHSAQSMRSAATL